MQVKEDGLLAPRYHYSGIPHMDLNPVQQRARSQVEKKIKEGLYRFEEIQCPICAGSDLHLLSEQDRYGLRMPVCICKGCGFLLTNPRMDQESYAAFYNSEYRPLYEGEEKPSTRSFRLQNERGERIVPFVQRFLSRPPAETLVLEVGCGSGGVLASFRRKGYQVKGVDLGDEHLRYGVTEHGLDLETKALCDLELERPPNLIIYSHVMEHILDLPAELAVIREKLADDGLLYIEVPGVKFVQFTYGGDFLRMLQNAHTFHFTLRTLTNLLEINGFNRLAGDEVIRSLFTPAHRRRDVATIQSDYQEVLELLKGVEAEYQRAEAVGLLRGCRYVDAAVRLAELTQICPEDRHAYALFAEALQQLGRNEEASRIRMAAATL